jgi:GTP-binding protein HflX
LRARRQRTNVPTVALVGYTNAGKTTLFNLLTGASAVVSNALFVTLDPLLRRIRLPDARQMMVSDTVGFIDRLPHQLVAAFRATLEEVVAADLLIHVIDASAGDRERRMEAVRAVLAEVGAASVPVLELFNKIDLVPAAELAGLRSRYPDAVFMAATRRTGRPLVVDAVARRLAMDAERVRFAFDSTQERDRRALADLYRHARVLSHVASESRVAVEADVPRRLIARFRHGRTSR